MTLDLKKLDITDRVVGKLKNGEIKLYLENEPIGRIKLTGEADFELDKRFDVDQQRIFQHITITQNPHAQYTDCQDGGWC
ncbi:YusG family protein [Bacillus sp. FJAT-27245]|uniref:YusG family protein n=1 Tax=Bacillus sp. FJAT-27245 TaxID=1684144 RepID=UPI0006A7E3BD|nr:YusG family protein [Bacillus sp. FJAT-27245]